MKKLLFFIAAILLLKINFLYAMSGRMVAEPEEILLDNEAKDVLCNLAHPRPRIVKRSFGPPPKYIQKYECKVFEKASQIRIVTTYHHHNDWNMLNRPDHPKHLGEAGNHEIICNIDKSTNFVWSCKFKVEPPAILKLQAELKTFSSKIEALGY